MCEPALRAVLSAGGDVAARTHTGDTPLHYAAMSGKRELMLCLLDAGADAAAVNNAGRTPAAMLSGESELALATLFSLYRQGREQQRSKCALSSCFAATTPDGGPLLKCGGCRAVRYCGVAHQADDWRACHRRDCRRLACAQAALDALSHAPSNNTP